MIFYLLAQAAAGSGPSGDDIKTWLLVVSVLANGVAGLRVILGRSEKREIANDPLIVQQHQETVTKRELEAVNAERNRNLVDLKAMIGDLRKDLRDDFHGMEERLSEVFNRLNNHAERIARIEGGGFRKVNHG